MFELKGLLKSYRIHELAMFILEQQREDWGQREVPALTNAVVSRYEEIVRSLMVQMKNSERSLEIEEAEVDNL